MSFSRRPDAGRGDVRRGMKLVQMPLLDRLFDEAPERAHDAPRTAGEAMEALRRSVRRDLEMLLNARRCRHTTPAELGELSMSPITFGIPDCAAAGFSDKRERERLRGEIEAALRRFEPRFAHVTVQLLDNEASLEATLRLHIDALLHAEPAPEPIAFDTALQPSTAITVRSVDV
jgi:type VI secretion system protein ImpF